MSIFLQKLFFWIFFEILPQNRAFKFFWKMASYSNCLNIWKFF